MFKKSFLALIIVSVTVAGLIIFYFARNNSGNLSVSLSPTPSISASFSPSPSPSPKPTPKLTPSTPSPTPTPSGSPSLWEQLSGEASCELKGEIKYLTSTIYDNQDALFTYKGVDHPGRLVNWIVSPNDGLSIGPNLFAQLSLPNGESLIGVSLPESPKYKSYELTASITYGRLIDGVVEVFTKQCSGKTTVVLP
jgi:hypothetical protein